MDVILRKTYIPFSIFIVIIAVSGNDVNETTLNVHRESRSSGRIVKLYSGPRPEPIICTDEGFRKDPYNCAIFYRCVKSGSRKYTVYRFQCGPGTVYDPDTEVCNHPRNTKRSECGGYMPPIEETTHNNEIESVNNEVPSPIVTNKPIYLTTENYTKYTIATEKLPVLSDETPDNTYPWGSTVNHAHSDSSITIKPTSSAPLFISSTTSNILQSTSRDNICTADGFMGDTENCRKFYRCVANDRGGYIRYEFTCSENTIWDEEYEVCNHVWAVKRTRCTRFNNKVNDYDINEKPYNVDSDIKKNTDEYSNPQKESYIGYDSKLPQVETQTNSGQQIYYDNQINDSKENKQNYTDISYYSTFNQPQDQNNYDNGSYQISDQILEATTIKIKTTVRENYNSTMCTEDGFIGNPGDCHKFYRCVNDGKGGFNKIEFSCAEGTVWDQTILACNHAWAVKECGVKGSTSTTHSVTTTSPKITQSYYTTTSTENYAGIPESDNTNYDNGYISQKPLSTVSTTTTIRQPIISSQTDATNNVECTSSGFMGDENDCNVFYRCVENSNGGFTKHIFKCGEGTVWDPQIQACNHAWAVSKCGGNTSIDTNQNESAIDMQASSTSIHVQSTTTSYITPGIAQDNEQFQPGYGVSNDASSIITTTFKNHQTASQGNVVCTSSGFIGDRFNCKNFYRCVENDKGDYIRYEFTCSEGTVWDDRISACNHASAVDKCGETSTGSFNDYYETTPQYHPASEPEFDTGYPSNDNIDSNVSVPSSTTTEAIREPSNNTACTGEGFMGDKNNCKKFYRCVNNGMGGFIRYEFDCGQGTVWDQSIQACNHASTVKECNFTEVNLINITGTSTSTEGVVIPSSTVIAHDQDYPHTTVATSHSENISDVFCLEEGFLNDPNNCKKFYRCVNDGNGAFTKYDFTCGEGTYWSQEILACDHITSDNECGDRVSSSIPPIQEHEDTYTETSTTTRVVNQITQKPLLPISWECTSEGFLADKNDCKKFYRCVDNGNGNYTKYDFTCGEGTIWDPEIQACNHDSGSKCTTIPSTTPSPSEGPGATDEQLQHTHNDKPISATTEADYSSTTNHIQCVSEGYFAAPNDCTRFIHCVKTENNSYIRHELACPDGTVWVQEMLTCYENKGETCKSPPASNPTLPEKQPHTTEFYVTSTSRAPSDEQHNQKPSSTSDICITEGFYGNKNNCREFYRCVDNGQGGYTKYNFTCSEGTAWDSHTTSCNYIDQVPNCHGPVVHDEHNIETTQHSTSTSQYSSTASPQYTSTSPNPNTEMTTQESAKTSEKPSTVAAQMTTTTTQPTIETTSKNSNSNISTDTCVNEGFFGDSQDCKKFYRCVDNGQGGYTKYNFDCGEGTIWDQNVITCNHPENVVNPSCKHAQTGNTIGTSSSTSTSSGTSPSNMSESSNTAQGQEQDGNSKNPGYSSVNCTKAGFFANPDDCKKFYRCVDWDGNGTRFSVYHFDCGEGTIWDPAVETCNHEESVYPPRTCSGSQSQNENQPSTTEAQEETIIESTTQSLTETTSQSTTEVTTQSTTDSTTQSTTDSTTQSTMQSTTEAITQTTIESTTRSTTESTTQSTTQSTPESTTLSTSELTTQSTTESTTQAVTELTTQSTTQSTTQFTTTDSTEQTTTLAMSSTTSNLNESTTETPGETTTNKVEVTTTDKSSETTTGKSEESTTEKQEQSTTDKPEENTTAKCEQTTTEKSEDTTTEKSEETTTTKIETSTTEKLDESTTEKLGESTTEKLEVSTTEKMVESTTDISQGSTVEIMESSTTEMSSESTTELTQGTTEQTSENTTQTMSSTTEETSETSTTAQSTEEYTTVAPTDKNSTEKECPKTEEEQHLFVCPSSFRRHPKYCNLFYQCDENEDTHEMKIATFTCPNNTIYDESQIKCVEENKADKKCEGDIAQKRRVKRKGALDENNPIEVSKDSYACPFKGYFMFEKGSECSPGFLKCVKTKYNRLRGFVYQCPSGYVFWSVSRRCEPIKRVSDCKRSYANDWSKRWEIPIETKNVDWS